MQLAKPHVDVGLVTDCKEAMLDFWQGPVGLPFEELLPTGGGNHQHRHGLNGSVLKLNHRRDPLPVVGPSGYRELLIAREGLLDRRDLVDPDGNRVALLPEGTGGITGIGMRVAVRDLAAQASFYVDALGLEALGARTFRCGDTLLVIEPDPDASVDVSIAGRGYRYLTIQVRDCELEHRRALEHGAREGAPPRRMGDVAVFSMVRDPDGNWIEISQRRSLTGSLD